jgi:hypothetical protein
MGFGLVRVYYANGKPAGNQKITIEWNVAGIKTGVIEVFSNAAGIAEFFGVPSLSAGEGKVIGSFGNFTKFTVGSDIFGNFPEKEVTVFWNPSIAGVDAIKSALEQIAGYLALLAVLGVVGVIIYSVIKGGIAGKVFSRVKSMVVRGNND